MPSVKSENPNGPTRLSAREAIIIAKRDAPGTELVDAVYDDQGVSRLTEL